MKVQNKTVRCAGWLIKKLRTDAGMTQDQLSEATGVPQSTISYLELNAWNPRVALIMPIAEFFGIPLEQLYERVGTDHQTA